MKFFYSVLFTLMLTSQAFASTAGRTDHSGILVWAFLGFCALIVMAQIVPAIMMMVGVGKALHKDSTAISEQ
jgi:hypothetical protein